MVYFLCYDLDHSHLSFQMRLTSSVMAAVVSAIQKTRVARLQTQSVVPLLLPYLLRLTGWCYSLGVMGPPLEATIRLTLLELYEWSYGGLVICLQSILVLDLKTDIVRSTAANFSDCYSFR